MITRFFDRQCRTTTPLARLLVLCVLLFIAGCGDGNNTRHPNFVVLLADDLGLDWAPCYGDLVFMPNLRALCDAGLTFDTVWANPSCTTSRASILTGRYALRHRAGSARDVPGVETRRLRRSEIIIPEALSRIEGVNYTNAAIGKWHLSDRLNGGNRSAVTSAFQNYVGTTGSNYFEYIKNVDGTIVGTEKKYRTTAIVDNAIAWIQNQSAENPWFLWVGFYNPHLPFHLPPKDLHEFDDLEDRLYDRNNPNATHELPERALVRFPEAHPYFAAMLQALDTEIGRLVSHIEENVGRDTYIIFLSDNGTSGEVAISERPQYRFKGTVYEGGIRVPLIIRGPKIERPGRRVDELVNITDLYATIVELAGGQKTLDNMRRPLDSKSLTPYFPGDESSAGRSWIYAERGAEADFYNHAVRGERYKLIIDKDSLRLFDLETDKHEEHNRLNQGMSRSERETARELFSVFRKLYDSEDDPFTDVEPGTLTKRYAWLFCDEENDQACEEELR